jgi:hypothetical protein
MEETHLYCALPAPIISGSPDVQGGKPCVPQDDGESRKRWQQAEILHYRKVGKRDGKPTH